MNKLAAVFWDVDGTLADTELYGHRLAFNFAFQDYGLDWVWSKKMYIDLLKISGGLNRITHFRNTQNKQITDDLCRKIQLRKGFHYSKLIKSGKILPREGVLRLIEELASNGVMQIIVTTSGRESLEPFLNKTLHKHMNFFSELISYESVSKHKPFPDAYNLAIKLSNKHPSNCIAIEDSSIGIEACKAANLSCLLTLPTWVSSYENLHSNANSCVDSLGSLKNPSSIIYGKPLISNYVDYEYLSTIIN